MQWCIILDDCIALLLWKAWRRIDIFFHSAPSINLWTTVHKFESVLSGAVGPWCGCNRMTVTVGLDNGFVLIRQQAHIWTNDGLVRWSYLRHSARYGRVHEWRSYVSVNGNFKRILFNKDVKVLIKIYHWDLFLHAQSISQHWFISVYIITFRLLDAMSLFTPCLW